VSSTEAGVFNTLPSVSNTLLGVSKTEKGMSTTLPSVSNTQLGVSNTGGDLQHGGALRREKGLGALGLL
jgi:hypothetical protein